MKQFYILSLMFCAYYVNAQTLTEDYSDPSLWTQVGSLVTVNNGTVNFINNSPDSEQRRVYRQIGFDIMPDDCWIFETEFTPTSTSIFNGQNFPGHTVFALTESMQDPLFDCPNIPCTGYPNGTQDGISVVYSAINPPTGPPLFKMVLIEWIRQMYLQI